MQGLFDLIAKEILGTVYTPPEIVPIPDKDFEVYEERVYLPSSDLYLYDRLAEMYGISRQRVMRCVLHAVGKYVEQETARQPR